MPTNKHAIIRYHTLDRCFRNIGKKYFIEDLVKVCSEAVNNYSGVDSGVSKRQVQEDIKFMESLDGYSIRLKRNRDGKRVYYRYADTSFSIKSQPLNEFEAIKLKETLLTLSRFQGLPQFEWIDEMVTRLESTFQLVLHESPVISFDQNPFLKGLEFLSELYYAIVEKRQLIIEYKGVKTERIMAYSFSPHYLKQYNSRWFLFGVVKDRKDITNLPLDRIISIDTSKDLFRKPLVNYIDYFEDIVGVTVEEGDPVDIVIEVNDSLLPYIKSKPLHGSQKISRLNGRNILTLNVIPNYELESLLLSHGDGLILLEPERFKAKITSRIEKMLL